MSYFEKRAERRAQNIKGSPRFSKDVHQIAELAVTEYGAAQKNVELAKFLKMTQRRMPETVVEIGTHHGGTLFGLCQVATKNATIVSIDLPGGTGGGGYSMKHQTEMAQRRVAGQAIHFLRADSHKASTYHTLQKILDGRTIDCLFIDGDHSRAGVIDDYLLYGNLVTRDKGIIGVHDIVHNPFDDNIEVDQAWPVIKSMAQEFEYRTDEIIYPRTTRLFSEIACAGIGVVLK